MNALTMSGFFTGITCLSLALLILRYGTSDVQRSFGYQNFAISLWGFGNGFAGLFGNAHMAVFWWKIALVGGFFIIPLLLNHVLILNSISRKKLLLSLYAWAAMYPFICLAGLDGMQVKYVMNGFYQPTLSNALYAFYYSVWIVMALYVSLLVVSGYVKSQPSEKKAMLLYAVSYLGGVWGGGTYVFMTAFNINVFYPYGNFLISLYCVIVTYAIFRHKLFDIEVIIRKTLVFAGLLASVFAMLVLPTLIIQEYLLRSAGAGSRLIGLTISGIIIILTMQRIESFLINVTDKYLFQKKYDYKELLRTFTTEVLTVLELDRLAKLTVDKLSDIIKLKSAAVLLFSEEMQKFIVTASHNIKDPSIELNRPGGMITFMDETHGNVLLSELREKNIVVPEAIQDTFDKLSAELIMPLVLHEEVIGILSLGRKKSDENFTQDDLDILLPIVKTLSIAISNANLFDELGKTQAQAAQKEKMAVIGTLSAGINHEICNPLGIARGQCEAFLLNIKDGLYKSKSNEELIEKAKEIMAKVIKETDRAAAITKKLSSFAKPSKGESEFVSINKEIDEVFGLVGYELRLDKIEFEKKVPDNIPDLMVDKKQFQEVLFNLMRNAGQAIGEKGKITLNITQDKGTIYIDVQDTGSGIPEDKIKQLFNPFFTTKDPGKGTGLGLFIVRQIVEKNGGKIYLKETKVGEGTTFRLEFPVAVKEEAEASK